MPIKSKIMTTITTEQKEKLTATCNSLFKSGVPSLRFMRILHSDYQIICADDLESPDDFYDMNRSENQTMHDLLNCLGFRYSKFGICKA